MLAHTCLHTVISDSPGVGFVYAVCKGEVKLPRWYSVQVIEGRCSRRRIVLRRNPWMTKPSVDKPILCMVSDRWWDHASYLFGNLKETAREEADAAMLVGQQVAVLETQVAAVVKVVRRQTAWRLNHSHSTITPST